MNEWREIQITVDELKERLGIPKKCKITGTSMIDGKNILSLKIWVKRK